MNLSCMSGTNSMTFKEEEIELQNIERNFKDEIIHTLYS